MILLLIILNFLYPFEIYSSIAGSGAAGGAAASNRVNLDATDLIRPGILDGAGFPLGIPEWDIDPDTGREIKIGKPLSLQFPFLEKVVELFLRSDNELQKTTDHYNQPQIIVEVINDAGNRSQRLYKASLKEGYRQRTILFLKMSKPGTLELIRQTDDVQAVTRLKALQDDALILAKLHESQQTRPDITMPNIILLTGIVTYEFNNSTKTIEITRAAQGETVDSIIKATTTSSNHILAKLQRTAYLVGLTLANIQKLFLNYNGSDNPSDWDTLQHHDFHPGNIFFDESLNQISWIDNETMNISPDILFDLKTHLSSVLLRFNASTLDLENIYVTELLKGYLEGYSSLSKKSQFLHFLLSTFNNNQKIYPILEQLIGQIPSSTATSQSNNNDNTNQTKSHAHTSRLKRAKLAPKNEPQTIEHLDHSHHSAHDNNHHYLDEEQIKDFEQLYYRHSNDDQEDDGETNSQADDSESWLSKIKRLIW